MEFLAGRWGFNLDLLFGLDYKEIRKEKKVRNNTFNHLNTKISFNSVNHLHFFRCKTPRVIIKWADKSPQHKQTNSTQTLQRQFSDTVWIATDVVFRFITSVGRAGSVNQDELKEEWVETITKLTRRLDGMCL